MFFVRSRYHSESVLSIDLFALLAPNVTQGADLANLVNEAALLAGRANKQEVGVGWTRSPRALKMMQQLFCFAAVRQAFFVAM